MTGESEKTKSLVISNNIYSNEIDDVDFSEYTNIVYVILPNNDYRDLEKKLSDISREYFIDMYEIYVVPYPRRVNPDFLYGMGMAMGDGLVDVFLPKRCVFTEGTEK